MLVPIHRKQLNRCATFVICCIMCRAALGRPIDLYDLRKFDAQLGSSLEKLAAAHRSWAAAGAPLEPLLVDLTPIEDLCLSFVLPGVAESPSTLENTVHASGHQMHCCLSCINLSICFPACCSDYQVGMAWLVRTGMGCLLLG